MKKHSDVRDRWEIYREGKKKHGSVNILVFDEDGIKHINTDKEKMVETLFPILEEAINPSKEE